MISGCSSTKTTVTDDANITPNVASDNGIIINSSVQYPNIHANVTEADITHRPKMAATTVNNNGKKINAAVGRIAQQYSYNWAGYSIDSTVGSVSDIQGSWIVPTVRTTTPKQYSCNWIGIDGDNSPTVEQIGTDSDTDSRGRPVYYAWYEFYPEPCYIIPMAISAGDKMSARVSYSDNNMTLSIVNQNTKKSFVVKHSADGYSRSSAEWITEAPYNNGILPLTNIGTTLFGQRYTFISGTCSATIDSVSRPIDSYQQNINTISMINDKNEVKAQPSPLVNDTMGTSFNVAWVRAS